MKMETLALNCPSGGGCGLGFTQDTNTIYGGSGVLPSFELPASLPLNGSSPVVPITNGFLFVVAPFGVSVTGNFVDAGTAAPLATPLPAAFPLFGTALVGLGGFGWLKRRGKVSRPPRG
jgi:hypothetical protein